MTSFFSNLLSRRQAPPEPKPFSLDRISSKKSVVAAEMIQAEREAAIERGEAKIDLSGGGQIGAKEWMRILSLPIRPTLSLEDIERVSYELVDAEHFKAGFRLLRDQVDGLVQYRAGSGLLGQARVGAGKTLLGLLIASDAAKEGMTRIILMIPSQVYTQLMEQDLAFYRARVPIQARIVGLGGLSAQNRMSMVRTSSPHIPTCFVLPYSLLSTKDGREIIDAIDPQLWINDEAHMLRHRSSARTKRWIAFMDARPACRFVAMSGTLTTKSLKDYHHFARRALRERCPMPLQVTSAMEWGALLDSGADTESDRGKALQPLKLWVERKTGQILPPTIEGYQEAYRFRLSTAPGVVMTQGQEDFGSQLQLSFLQTTRKPNDKLVQHLKDLDNLWLSPTGDEIAYAIHLYKWRYELSAGFFYALEWPEPSEKYSLEEIDAAKQHHAAQQLYNRALRLFLEDTSIPGLDTPMLVGAALSRPDRRVLLPSELGILWDEARKLIIPNMPERISRPVRVDDYKIEQAIAWAKDVQRSGKGGILWCYHNEIADWLLEEAVRAGLNPLSAKAGQTDILLGQNAGRIVVASMEGHGTGKNLQHFSRQLFVQWPRPAHKAEQTIGRTHRRGQKAAKLLVEVLMGIDFDHFNVAATLIDSMYIQLTTGNEQKLLCGQYLTPPKLYDSRLLKKLGFANKELDSKGQRELSSKTQGLST